MIRRLLLSLSVLSLFAFPAQATWSIVVIKRSTGEVGIGAATCIANTNLIRGLPAIVVGKGGAVMQAFSAPQFLPLIADGIEAGLDPADILAMVEAADSGFQQRQIAIVSFDGAPVNHTGTGAMAARGGVVGDDGDLIYAIQGNVLTGPRVWLDAEEALLNTPGDLGQKLLAAMVAARDRGGDGRCSCMTGGPTDCGSPPAMFDKSAHVGFIAVSRVGDNQSPCENGGDCLRLPVYLAVNVRGGDAQQQDPDPVTQIVERYPGWREERIGQPDGILSIVSDVAALPADGRTKRVVTIQLADIDGTAITTGNDNVVVQRLDTDRAVTTASPVVDHGDGTYSFTLTAGVFPGTDEYQITATPDDWRKVTLFPSLTVQVDPLVALHAGAEEVSAAQGASVPFTLNVPEQPGAMHWIVGGLSGTVPGLDVGPVHLPLNVDRFTLRTIGLANRADLLPGTYGFLDSEGRAEAAFSVPPGLLRDLVGRRMDWAAVLVGDGPLATTNAVGFEIVP